MDSNRKLGLQCSESDSDISFSESLGEEYEMQVQELLLGSDYLKAESESESESEFSLKDWLEENNQTNIETNHQQDVVQFDTVKAEDIGKEKRFGRRSANDLSINLGSEVDDENELGMKPSKRIKFDKASTSTIDSTDELPKFSFYGEETAVAEVNKDNSKEKNNNEE
ncbi:uncharacterized protein LOC122080394 [Macadamia integrifolia]|uniref:uncharacterized protein LOC122080394 n=1 Tax=Macadamia integrifolia TaxID=60698 RepID=UPI001C4FC1B3|nr:uncharacterized protein LOC122080394 [Macadamia integrifolia]XP_042503286.1 uncharacterized protein LOC122080394 [Macadamia integrifolia]